ncbi:peptide/nickel transport system substrate-binding protein [Desulfatibacillum alkenivorans DSM 16219]|jgi:peptide/nickel transport system substrate-binding protein|uniref:Peptide/nickel transport system substrate-binding protein n=1 Tax=Desulfatibacillum alkenivorans DSM 16219 TaxID=1121393 RepID=A0A1M6XD79_9BACT|nr:ABC transporter substrate-binding protein [Desulfatibacillum alkenivorans]SHL03916.1 peptide/nickel transport system substrate-binding protein [Desulfatibacillum alkenivorans DSM 16219]
MKKAFKPITQFICLFLVLAGMFTACQGREKASEAGELVFRIGSPMTIRRVNSLADYGYSTLAMLMTHDTLVRFDENLRPIPQLASKWRSNENATEWVFTITDKAKWHDGVPVTPEDIVFTFNYLADTQVAGYSWVKQFIDEMIVDGQDVIFRLNKPYSRFLSQGGYIVRILPKHVWEGISDPEKAEDERLSIGCGPFLFQSFNMQSNQVSFVKNPDYYLGAPLVDKVVYTFYKNQDVLTMALVNGEVDAFYKYASGYPPGKAVRLKNQEGITIAKAPSLGVPAAMGFNPHVALTADLRVRKAITLAINYKRIGDSVALGEAQVPGPGFVPASFPYFAHMPAFNTDIEQSKALLAEAGLIDHDGDGILETPEGEPVCLKLIARSDLFGDKQATKLLIHDLAQVGIAVDVMSADLSTWMAKINKDDYHLILFRATPWGMLMGPGYGTGYFDSRTKGSGRLSSLDSPAFHALCDEILATTNPDRLKELYTGVQEQYAAQLPAIALYWTDNLYPYSDKWEGLVVNQIEGGLANRLTWKSLRKKADAGEAGP